MARKKISLISIIAIISFIGVTLFSQNTNAVSYSRESIYKHILISRFPTCFSSALVSRKATEKYASEMSDTYSAPVFGLFNNGFTSTSKESSKDRFYLPTKIGNNITETDSNGGTIGNCFTLLFGANNDASVGNGKYLRGSANGLISRSSVPKSYTDSGFQRFTQSLGYTIENKNNESANTLVCVKGYSSNIKKESNPSYSTYLGMKCFNKQDLESGTINEAESTKLAEYIKKSESASGSDAKYNFVKFSYGRFSDGFNYYFQLNTCLGKSTIGICNNNPIYQHQLGDTISLEKINEMNGKTYESGDAGFRVVVEELPEAAPTDGSTITGSSVLVRNNLESAVKLLSDGKYEANGQSLEFKDTEKYQLYMYYLRDIYGFMGVGSNGSCQAEKPSKYNQDSLQWVWLNQADGKNWCPANVDSTKANEKVTVFGGNKRTLTKVVSLDGLLEEMFGLDYTNMSELEPYNGENGDPGEGGDGSEPNNCYDNSASLGWIICPIMDKLSVALDKLYDDIIQPFLVIEPSLLDEDNGAFEAWQIMVNLANILMVIFLLFIIFSQLTGVGIDNYGIKKSLPKILVAALLINLSYLICQFAVDISNVVGNSINDLLTNIGYGIKPSVPAEVYTEAGAASQDQAAWFKGLVTLGVGGLVGIGIANVALNVVNASILPGIVIPALILIVTAIFSVIFFFVILGARKAGVVVMVVIAPLAFACYMLPNMKKYYDKWFKIFSGLLMVYPICGLLVGGGYLVSRVLLQSSSEYIMYFTASALAVVPYFFIPSMLKGSLNVMGGLGTKISGFGKNLGSRAGRNLGKTIESSKGYQEHVKQSQEQAAVSRANRIKEKLGKKDQKDLTWRQRRSLYDAQKALIADEDRERRIDNMTGTGFEAALAGVAAKAKDEEVSNRLFLMQKNGINGKAYTLDNMDNRMRELAGQEGDLSSDQQLEMAALARGMAQEKGGAGKLAKIVRSGVEVENNGVKTNKEASKSFMRSLGDIYANDSTVRGKMREKDTGASIYTEQFMQGGNEAGGASFSDFQGTEEYTKAMKNRIKSHEAGLSQSGAAFEEYLRGINTKEELQDIMNNQDLLQQLDVDQREKVVAKANGAGVYGPRAMDVNVLNASSAPASTPTSTQTPAPTSTPTQAPTPVSTPAQPGEAFIVHGASGDQAVTIRDGRAFDQNGNEFDNSRAVARRVRQIVDQRNNNGNNNDNNNGENNVNNNQPQ